MAHKLSALDPATLTVVDVRSGKILTVTLEDSGRETVDTLVQTIQQELRKVTGDDTLEVDSVSCGAVVVFRYGTESAASEKPLNYYLLDGDPWMVTTYDPQDTKIADEADFVDISDDAGLVKITWNAGAPAWRQASPGLCVEGVCMNRECKAYEQHVIMSLGFMVFDLFEDCDICECPICYQRVVPTTCAFNNCRWKWVGEKIDSVVIRSDDWKIADNAYHYFNEDTSGKANWLHLKITAEPVKGNVTCTLCSYSCGDDSRKELNCCHVFHPSCIDNWLKNNSTCPMCLARSKMTPFHRRKAGLQMAVALASTAIAGSKSEDLTVSLANPNATDSATAKKLTMDNFREVNKAVYEARQKWKEIGTELGLRRSDLNNIISRGNDKCLAEMLEMWLKKASLEPSWEKLAAALREETVAQEDVAEAISKKYLL